MGGAQSPATDLGLQSHHGREPTDTDAGLYCLLLSCGFPWSVRIAAAIATVGELASAQLALRKSA